MRRTIQPLWQLGLLSTLTLGLYDVYWVYRTWRVLRDVGSLEQATLSPGWRTAGLLAPFLNIVLIYHLFRGVRDLTRPAEPRCPQPAWHLGPGRLTTLYCALAVLWRLPGLASLCALLSVAPLLVVQGQLNGYLAARLTAPPHGRTLGAWEWAALVVGTVITLLAIVGTVTGG